MPRSASPRGIDWFELGVGILVDGERIDLIGPIVALIASPGFDAATLQSAVDDVPFYLPLEDGRVLALQAARHRPDRRGDPGSRHGRQRRRGAPAPEGRRRGGTGGVRDGHGAGRLRVARRRANAGHGPQARAGRRAHGNPARDVPGHPAALPGPGRVVARLPSRRRLSAGCSPTTWGSARPYRRSP